MTLDCLWLKMTTMMMMITTMMMMMIIIIIIIWLVKDLVRWGTNSLKWHTSSANQNQIHTAFYKTLNSLPRAQLSLLWATSIQSTASRPIFKAILTLSFHLRLGLLSGLFPSYFPQENPVRISCVPHTLSISTSLILHQSNIWWQAHITKILISKSSPFSCHSTVPTSQYVFTSDTSTLRPGLHSQDQVLHPYKTTKHVLFCTCWSVCTCIANAKTKLNFCRS